jgi:hypothetical protein
MEDVQKDWRALIEIRDKRKRYLTLADGLPGLVLRCGTDLNICKNSKLQGLTIGHCRKRAAMPYKELQVCIEVIDWTGTIRKS